MPRKLKTDFSWSERYKDKSRKELPMPEESYFFTDNLRDKIVQVGNKIFEVKEIRKSILRQLTKCQHSTFNNAIKYLKNIGLVIEVTKVPHVGKKSKKSKRKVKYIKWVGIERPDIIENLKTLTSYQEIDLLKYPIKDLEYIRDKGILILKKFIFRMNSKSSKRNKSKENDIFNLLEIDKHCLVNTIKDVYRMHTSDFYIAVKNLIENGKIYLGIYYDNRISRNRIVLYKRVDWVLEHTQWKCNNCNHINPGSNINFCGKCGDERNI